MNEILGDPRQAALEGVEFRLVPHRTDESKDTPDVWVWKLQTYVIDDEGFNRLHKSELL